MSESCDFWKEKLILEFQIVGQSIVCKRERLQSSHLIYSCFFPSRSVVTGVAMFWGPNQWLVLPSWRKPRLKSWLPSWVKNVLDLLLMLSVHKNKIQNQVSALSLVQSSQEDRQRESSWLLYLHLLEQLWEFFAVGGMRVKFIAFIFLKWAVSWG